MKLNPANNNMDDDAELSVESRIPPPSLSCPKCDSLLPSELGTLTCVKCEVELEVDHEGTRKAWREEKVSCPSCAKVLIAGVGERPANLRCVSCESDFVLTPNIPREEITCPKCERRLRLRKRPGARQISCPACETDIRVEF